MGFGRFGPVYRAHDPATDQAVIVRTFMLPMGTAERDLLLEALTHLCESPLDHPSIARPLATGIEGGHPYLVHTLLPGVPFDAFIHQHGPQTLPEVALRATQLAAAIDFAAAAGVHHGALGPGDVILGLDSSGISGFGLVQAVAAAGIRIEGDVPTWAADVAALAAIAFELLHGHPPVAAGAPPAAVRGADPVRLQRAFDAALGEDSGARPQTALEFAAALQDAIVQPFSEAPAMSAAPPDQIEPTPPPGVTAPDTVGFVVPPEPSHAAPPLPEVRDDRLHTEWTMEPLEETTFRDDRFIAPAADVEVPLQVRRDEIRPDAVAPPPMFAAASSKPSRSTGWLLWPAILVLGIASSFAFGYLVRDRGEPLPFPDVASEALGRSGSASPAAAGQTVTEETLNLPDDSAPGRSDAGVGTQGTEPTGTARGRADSIAAQPETTAPADSTAARRPDAGTPAGPGGQTTEVEPPSTPGQPAGRTGAGLPAPRVSAAEPQGPVPDDRPARRAPEPAPPATGPGSMQVLSRPEGAEVWIDNRLVGQTPFLMAVVPPGAHDVRIELAGHRRWATTVRVSPGERLRVAASLEQ